MSDPRQLRAAEALLGHRLSSRAVDADRSALDGLLNPIGPSMLMKLGERFADDLALVDHSLDRFMLRPAEWDEESIFQLAGLALFNAHPRYRWLFRKLREDYADVERFRTLPKPEDALPASVLGRTSE
ncbi:hypothetical protein V3331_10290 [Gaopeijia maritima]|uniref:hypothetical protein n=1 Tax=Gaopeijia maritima TaxID=3119007 RepID=UPI003244AD6F